MSEETRFWGNIGGNYHRASDSIFFESVTYKGDVIDAAPPS